MAVRSGLCVFIVAALSTLAGCRVGAARGSASRDVDVREIADLRSESGPRTSEAVYERAVAMAATPEEKAKAFIALGRAQLKVGRVQNALKSFYEARRLAYEDSLAPAINLGLGEAYYEAGDFTLARRYLSKAADEGVVRDRDVLFAKLVMCCRAMDDVDAAAAYRGKLAQPLSDEARSVLAAETRSGPGLVADGAFAAPPAVRGGSRPAPIESDADSQEKLHVYSRTSWNAKEPRKNIEPMGHVDKITVHHSGGDNIWSSSAADTAEEIRKIQRYHQNEQGWADIGYHYIIDRSGAIWQGRKLQYQGAHARGSANSGNVGIVVLGNYMHQSVTPLQRESLETLIQTLCDHFEVPANRIYTHREILSGKTDCPGPELSRCVNEIRSGLRRRMVAYRP